jgi:Flp pilus assembly protein CpaB
VDVQKTLRSALGQLEVEKARIERQMASLRLALRGAGASGAGGRRRQRSTMSPAARRAVSKRMKAYWAKRRAAAGKG